MLSTGRGTQDDSRSGARFFRAMAAGKLPFVIEEGGGGPERAQFVCGFLGCDVRPFNPLLGMLPRLLHMPRPAGARSDLLERLIDLTLAETQIRNPGEREAFASASANSSSSRSSAAMSRRAARKRPAGSPGCVIRRSAARSACCMRIRQQPGPWGRSPVTSECRARSWRSALRGWWAIRRCSI